MQALRNIHAAALSTRSKCWLGHAAHLCMEHTCAASTHKSSFCCLSLFSTRSSSLILAEDTHSLVAILPKTADLPFLPCHLDGGGKSVLLACLRASSVKTWEGPMAMSH